MQTDSQRFTGLVDLIQSQLARLKVLANFGLDMTSEEQKVSSLGARAEIIARFRGGRLFHEITKAFSFLVALRTKEAMFIRSPQLRATILSRIGSFLGDSPLLEREAEMIADDFLDGVSDGATSFDELEDMLRQLDQKFAAIGEAAKRHRVETYSAISKRTPKPDASADGSRNSRPNGKKARKQMAAALERVA